MELSEELKKKCLEFKNAQAVSLGGLTIELKKYYQQTYGFSIDHNCNSCIGKALTRIIKDQNI